MAIEKAEFENELKKLNSTRAWLKNEISSIEKNDEELKNKIAILKKASKGSYNEELETTKKLLEITSKNLHDYSEATEQPYFARIDFREYRRDKESYYIGKFGLGDSATGDEVVVDWRAPIADLYYSGTQGEAYYTAPIGIIDGELSLKRKFLFKDENIKDIFDEGINEIILKAGLGEENALVDEFLKINLEESISSKLKDVVATIQKEQNEIIRAEKNQPVIVQGSAGSGKTTVALHRLAYLLYRFNNKLSSEEILVIAPNKLFLDYISEVLPNLGVDKVKQKTFEEISTEILELKGKHYTKDKKLAQILEIEDEDAIKFITNSSKIKGSMIYRSIMDRYLQLIEIRDNEVESIKVEDYVLFDVKEIKRLYSKDMVNLPINKRKDDIKKYLSLKLNDKISDVIDRVDFGYEYQIARLKKTMDDGNERRMKLIDLYNDRDKRKAELKEKCKTEFDDYFFRWKCIDTKNLYYNIFENDNIFEEVTEEKIPDSLAKFMKEEIKSNKENNVVDSDDLAAMLYLKLKIDGLPEKFKFQHIVIDEAQDYSLFQLYISREIAYNKSLTIVGDIGQGIYYYKGLDDWDKLLNEVFNGDGVYMPLSQSYRSTVEIIHFANEILKQQNNNLKPATPVLRHGDAPEIIYFENNKNFAEKLDFIVKEVQAKGKNSVAVIGRTYKECKKIKEILKKYSNYQWDIIKDTDSKLILKSIIIPAYMTKGLEFDCSVIYDCNDINYSDTELNKKLLYVALTRALHMEYVFYSGNISPLLLPIVDNKNI